MATAAIAHETIALTVASLQSNWGLSTQTETPATSHGLILPFIWACEDDSETTEPTNERKPRKIEEHSRTKCAIIDTAVSSSPGAWLSQGIVDCLLSEGYPKLKQAEEDRCQRLRDVQSAFVGIRHHGRHTTQGTNSGFDLNDEMFAEELVEETGKNLDTEQYAFEKEGPQAGADDEVDAEDKEAGEVDPDTEENTEYEVAIVGDGASDKLQDLAYSAWSSAPSSKTKGEFFANLYPYVQARYGRSKVAAKLYQADEIEDGASDLAMTLLGTLERMLTRGEVLRERACKYVSKAMSESRKGTVNDLAKRQKNTLQDEYTESEGDESFECSQLDDIANAAWDRRNDSDGDAEYEEAVTSSVKAKWKAVIESGYLPVDLQPTARLYYLHGLTQKKIEAETGLSQGAVSKQLQRVREIGAAYIAAKKAAK